MSKQPKWMTVTGRVLSVLIAGLLSFSAVMKFQNSAELMEQWTQHFGYPAQSLFPIAVAETACVVLFLVRPTAVFGAVMTTGYLGGAIATHVRVGESFVPPLIVGVLVWLALYFRDGRIRELLPLRQPDEPSPDVDSPISTGTCA